jgi:hypothetical protein
MDAERHYWFRLKRYGRGWGLPCSWQGWIFFIAWLVALAIAVLELMPQRPFAFTLVLAVLALLYVAVCYIKGEPLTGSPRQTNK